MDAAVVAGCGWGRQGRRRSGGGSSGVYRGDIRVKFVTIGTIVQHVLPKFRRTLFLFAEQILHPRNIWPFDNLARSLGLRLDPLSRKAREKIIIVTDTARRHWIWVGKGGELNSLIKPSY